MSQERTEYTKTAPILKLPELKEGGGGGKTFPISTTSCSMKKVHFDDKSQCSRKNIKIASTYHRRRVQAPSSFARKKKCVGAAVKMPPCKISGL